MWLISRKIWEESVAFFVCVLKSRERFYIWVKQKIHCFLCKWDSPSCPFRVRRVFFSRAHFCVNVGRIFFCCIVFKWEWFRWQKMGIECIKIDTFCLRLSDFSLKLIEEKCLKLSKMVQIWWHPKTKWKKNHFQSKSIW